MARDLGIALDGDADRLLMADEQGELIDGDQILALIAQSWAADGRLRGDGIVATVMSNLGLERFLDRRRGLVLHRTKVGDRYVAEHMREVGMNLGGEQSGHVILSDFATTGDGLLAALQVLAVIVDTGTRGARGLPRVHAAAAAAEERALLRRLAAAGQARSSTRSPAAEAELNGSGRLLIRESGTEPLIRVMAEGEDEAARQPHRRRAVRDDRRGDACPRGRRLMQRPRAGDCRVGFRRRCRHPGRHQDDHRLRRLRRHRHHRVDGAGHARGPRQCTSRAAGLHRAADRRACWTISAPT